MSEIKTYFVSRYGDKGSIMEADFSQLEVIYLAHITKDVQLIADILSGMDMHTVRAAELFGIPEKAVTKEQRRTAKAFSFMLQYGAGARHMAERTGHKVAIAEQFIHNYYSRYPQVRKWQRGILKLVDKGATPVAKHTPKGYPMSSSTLQSETGRKYTFFTGDAPDWMRLEGRATSFKPTEVKNYPIQGGATGDVVPMVLGEIYRWLVKEDLDDKVKLVATVHDSIVLDMPTNMCYSIGTDLKKIMQRAPEFYEKNFGIKFNLPLFVGITYGPSWGEQRTEIS